MITQIVSGGQTGADRAALDFALQNGIPHGGWIPRGRITEDGPLPDNYRLREMETDCYEKRTEQNVIDSSGTLIVARGELTGGSALTRDYARHHRRPCLHIDLADKSIPEAAGLVKRWLDANGIKTLNVAGPRASKDPLIYAATLKLLAAVVAEDLC